MQSSNGTMSIEEAVGKMRDDLLRSNSQAHTVAINGFDSLVNQMKMFGVQLNDKNIEIVRLQELCKKNKIDYAVPPKVPHAGEVAQVTPKPKSKN